MGAPSGGSAKLGLLVRILDLAHPERGRESGLESLTIDIKKLNVSDL